MQTWHVSSMPTIRPSSCLSLTAWTALCRCVETHIFASTAMPHFLAISSILPTSNTNRLLQSVQYSSLNCSLSGIYSP